MVSLLSILSMGFTKAPGCVIIQDKYGGMGIFFFWKYRPTNKEFRFAIGAVTEEIYNQF